MSELIQKNDNRATIRWKLLTGASALALTAYVSSTALARAEDTNQPQIWIELGGQLNRLQDGQETFAPVFPNSPSRPSYFDPSQKFEKPPLFSIDEDGKISFQPDNSDWVFSAAIRYGRSSSKRHVHQQTYPKSFFDYFYSSIPGLHRKELPPEAARFADTRAQNSERHLILDFQAGKDVGLGLFGSTDATSVVSVGVRFAQFRSKSTITLKSDPDWHFNYTYLPSLVTSPFPSFMPTSSKLLIGQGYHSNAATLRAQRSFRGVGPSLSWSASVPIAGNTQDGAIDVDWGLNAALLFGKQKTKTHHQTTGRSHPPYGYGYEEDPHNLYLTYQGPAHPDHTRMRNVTVPNVGGSIGLTWRVEDFKVNFGYKADFFFNAIDGGIDARKNENRAFYGPYASISIGLGD